MSCHINKLTVVIPILLLRKKESRLEIATSLALLAMTMYRSFGNGPHTLSTDTGIYLVLMTAIRALH